MKIGILSRESASYSTGRLLSAATSRNHEVQIFDTLKFSMFLEHGRPDLYYRHEQLEPLDAVIPRIGASITFFGAAVVKQFEQMGVYVCNESLAIRNSRDKLRAIQILSRHDVGIPTTVFVRDPAEVMPSIERLGGPPVIIKLLEGTQGVGVILAETSKVAEAIIQTLHSARQNVLIQKFVKESGGSDIRALVVGDRVVAAMRRRAAQGEFRSNVHRGGSTEKITLEPEFERTALRASQIMGLRVAGVDMLESDDGPQVLEINSSPGLQGIEAATGVDVAGAIIEHIEQNVLFPEVDVKQRLRLAGGYGVAEFHVHQLPELEGKSLREAPLEERNIHVLSITRGHEVIPNPHGDHIVLTGDVLMCYGELAELRKFLRTSTSRPAKRKKRPRPNS